MVYNLAQTLPFRVSDMALASPRLPPELIDHIVDHLQHEHSSLLACSLVSQNFLIASRYHLFQELPLRLHTTSVLMLLSLLSSPTNHIAPYVRRFSVSRIPDFLLHHGRSDVVRAIRHLPRALSLFPNIRSVKFAHSDLRRCPEDILLRLFSHFSHFYAVNLLSVHFERFSDFSALVCGFRCLHRLALKWVSWTHAGPHAAQPARRPHPSIRWHIHGNFQAVDLYDWLSSQNPPPLIPLLRYDSETLQHRKAATALLRRAAPSVEQLEIVFPTYVEIKYFMNLMHDFIDISGCIGLRAISFKQILLRPGDQMSKVLKPWVANILRQITSGELRELVLELHVARSHDDGVAYLDEFDWVSFKRALIHRRFHSLRSITFLLGPAIVDFARAVHFIRSIKLPMFASLIRIHHMKTGERSGCW
ncbi:hypothetical protein HGRIS_000119 [Hohenbuehelia grisea]|uniref:F-box domain-containing protein n=1 Tax=Hohenbuehelia grisea TaxID=104357 RepID=A0ABR3JRN5_9AGAR